MQGCKDTDGVAILVPAIGSSNPPPPSTDRPFADPVRGIHQIAISIMHSGSVQLEKRELPAVNTDDVIPFADAVFRRLVNSSPGVSGCGTH